MEPVLPNEIWCIIFSFMTMSELFTLVCKLSGMYKRIYYDLPDQKYKDKIKFLDFVQVHISTIKYDKNMKVNGYSLNIALFLDLFPYATKLIINTSNYNLINANCVPTPELMYPYFVTLPNIKYIDISKVKCEVHLDLQYVETLVLSHKSKISSKVSENARIIYGYDKKQVPCKPSSDGRDAEKYASYLYSNICDEKTLNIAKEYIESMINCERFGKCEDVNCAKYCNNEYSLKMLEFLYEINPKRSETRYSLFDMFVSPRCAKNILINMPIQTDIVKKAIKIVKQNI